MLRRTIPIAASRRGAAFAAHQHAIAHGLFQCGMTVPNLTHRLLAALQARGATCIFGIPGDFALPLFREIERDATLPLFTLSHEPAVAFAADATARMRGGVGVVAVTYGAGALNLVNAVAGAYAERVPLVVLSGAPAAREASSGLKLHHQVKGLDSQWRIFEELTVDRARLDDAATAPALIARVLDSALRESRPVYLEVPRDMAGVPCAAVPERTFPSVDEEALAACADELLARLAMARHPMMLIGVEVRRYGLEAQLAELASRLRIPVVTTFMGRGMLSEQPALLRGTYLGLAGDPEITAQVESSDGLLLLGVIVSDTNFAVSANRIDLRHTMLACEGRVAMAHHLYADVPLPRLVSALLARLPTDTRTHSPARPEPAGLSLVRPLLHPAGHRQAAALTPADIARAVNDLFGRHGPMPIASDVGDCLFTAMDLRPTALIAPGYYATMGYGVPAALGLQAATGLRPMVLVGDGAFQMTGFELGNAQRHGWDPIVLVFNNSGWGMLRCFEPEARFNDLPTWDFCAMAAGMGGDGYRVRTFGELEDALATAHAARGRFQLIDIHLPPDACSPTLRRFVQAVKRLSADAPA
jgi:indolepyruvate decarboxylase